MKKIIVFIMLLFAIPFVNVFLVLADSIAAPNPFTIKIEDENKILCITPTNIEDEYQPKSGLYYNEEPLRPIYYFDDYFHEYNWYLHENSLIVSNNGVYVVHIPWAQNRSWDHQSRQFKSNIDGEAILIYKNGVLLNSYTVGELVKDKSKLGFSESHVRWEQIEQRKFDIKENTLTITTNDNRVVFLDITTGNITFENPVKNNHFMYAIIGAGLLCVIFLGMLFLFKIKKRVFEK